MKHKLVSTWRCYVRSSIENVPYSWLVGIRALSFLCEQSQGVAYKYDIGCQFNYKNEMWCFESTLTSRVSRLQISLFRFSLYHT